MKKMMLAVLCAGTTVAASAQKSSVLLWGSFSGSAATENSPGGPNHSRNGFNILPGVGYQFTDKWTLGVEGEFDYNGNAQTMPKLPGSISVMGFGGGVFGRYTLPISNLLFFYTQSDLLYTARNLYKDGARLENATNNTLALRFTPAIGLNIKNGYAINFGFGNLVLNHEWHSSSTNSINYSFSQGFSAGISKNFLHHVKTVKKTSEKEGPDEQ
jgi:hypothetical protein